MLPRCSLSALIISFRSKLSISVKSQEIYCELPPLLVMRSLMDLSFEICEDKLLQGSPVIDSFGESCLEN